MDVGGEREHGVRAPRHKYPFAQADNQVVFHMEPAQRREVWLRDTLRYNAVAGNRRAHEFSSTAIDAFDLSIADTLVVSPVKATGTAPSLAHAHISWTERL